MHPLLFPWTLSPEILAVLAYVAAGLVALAVARMVYNRGNGAKGGPIAAGVFAFALAAWFVSTKTPFAAQPLPLHTYGLMIALGFLFGIHLAARAAEKYASENGTAFFQPDSPVQRKALREKGDTKAIVGKAAKEHLLDLAFWILAGALVGARVLFIVVNWGGPAGYGANPGRIFDITSGGLVFSGGTSDRYFRAFDARTGKVLWQFRTNSGITGVPTSFEVDGVQYVAVQSGWGIDAQKMVTRLDQTAGTSTYVPQGGVVWVFALQD